MSKAEERYLEHFQDGRLRKCSNKDAFLLGYRQAEKDLALTWEDMKMIDDISDNVYAECDVEMFDKKEYYQEVLKRFKERKGENV